MVYSRKMCKLSGLLVILRESITIISIIFYHYNQHETKETQLCHFTEEEKTNNNTMSSI